MLAAFGVGRRELKDVSEPLPYYTSSHSDTSVKNIWPGQYFYGGLLLELLLHGFGFGLAVHPHRWLYSAVETLLAAQPTPIRSRKFSKAQFADIT